MGGNATTGIFLSPKCVKRFLATVRSFWSWAFRLSSSSRARLVWRTPTVTLQRKTNWVSSTQPHTWCFEDFYECLMIGAGGFGLRKCILIESDLRAFDHSTFSEVKIFLQIFLQLFACTCAMMFYLILFRQAPNIILIANIFLLKLSVCVTTITIMM